MMLRIQWFEKNKRHKIITSPTTSDTRVAEPKYFLIHLNVTATFTGCLHVNLYWLPKGQWLVICLLLQQLGVIETLKEKSHDSLCHF